MNDFAEGNAGARSSLPVAFTGACILITILPAIAG
jgi:uncharacterized membrane protein YeaQ/YmgE (transglycosylase-associated protein family)